MSRERCQYQIDGGAVTSTIFSSTLHSHLRTYPYVHTPGIRQCICTILVLRAGKETGWLRVT